MRCNFSDNKLLLYIDKELDSATSAQLTAHFATCTDCRQSYEFLNQAYGIINKEKSSWHVNPFLSARVWEKLHGANEELQEPLFPLRRLALSSLAAAGMAMGIIIGSMVGNPPELAAPGNSENAWEQLADDYFPNETILPYENLPPNE